MIKLILTDWTVALLDEPTSALDIDGLSLLDKYMRLWQKQERSIIIVTHDYLWMKNYVQRAVVLQNGVIQRELKKQELIESNEISF